MAVLLQQHFTVDRLSVLFFQPLLHGWDNRDFRLDNAAGGRGFWKRFCQIRCEARQAIVSILNIALGQANIR